MRTACLTGWGQPHDALEAIAPGAVHVDYAREQARMLDIVAADAADAELVIGWSMGGHIAMRAIERGMIKPRRLVLIAPPFQFVASPVFVHGMKRGTFELFRENLRQNPERTLDKAYALIALHDEQGEQVRHALERQRKRLPAYDWLNLYDELAGYHSRDVDFSGFPPVLLVHGARDMVIDKAHSSALAEALPSAELHVWEGCGHAPHWHNPEALIALINTFTRS